MIDHPFTRALYLALAALAGSITALSFRPFQSMSKVEISIALFVGASFSIFVGPYIIYLWFGSGEVDYRIAGAMLYIAATGSNVLIPIAVKKLTEFFGGHSKDETL